jgi:uncharacterized coiled-coil DUF342 family protein
VRSGTSEVARLRERAEALEASRAQANERLTERRERVQRLGQRNRELVLKNRELREENRQLRMLSPEPLRPRWGGASCDALGRAVT